MRSLKKLTSVGDLGIFSADGDFFREWGLDGWIDLGKWGGVTIQSVSGCVLVAEISGSQDSDQGT